MKAKLLCPLLVLVFLFCSCGPLQGPEADVTQKPLAAGQSPFAVQISGETSEDAPAETQTAPPLSAPEPAHRRTQPQTQMQTQKPPTPTVTISVDCSNAIAHGILENEGYARILPADGKIFAEKEIEIREGETALAVLKRTMEAEKLFVLVTSGGYIKSIGYLPEFACGANSGWLYRVNGVRPPVGIKHYKLRAGDKLEFIYTCEVGDVP